MINHYDPNQPRNAGGEWTDGGLLQLPIYAGLGDAIRRAASDKKENDSIDDLYKKEKEKLGIKGNIKIEVQPENLKGWAVAGVMFEKNPDSEHRYFFSPKIVLKKAADNSKFMAHEMKHMQQAENKKMFFKGGHFYWNGEKHISKNGYNNIIKGMVQNQDKNLYDKSIKKYRELPWEKEADEYAGT